MNQRTVGKVVVNWARWKDQIPNKARETGFSDVAFFVSEDRDQVLAEMADADAALVAGWDAEQFGAGKDLRWVHAVSGGIEGHLFPEFVQSPVLFSCGKPTFAVPGAERDDVDRPFDADGIVAAAAADSERHAYDCQRGERWQQRRAYRAPNEH